jgi:hypothetical protein
VNTISGQINTISGQINTISGQVNNLNNTITITTNSNPFTGPIGTTVSILNGMITIKPTLIGYNIEIGTALSNVFINGNLYLNGGLVYRQQGTYNNAVEYEQWINQEF